MKTIRLNKNALFIVLAIAFSLSTLSACGNVESPKPDDDMYVERESFEFSLEEFKTAVLENTNFILKPSQKETILQFEDLAKSATLTAMLFEKQITTLVFQVQGISISEDNLGEYTNILNTIVEALTGQKASCTEELFTMAMSESVANISFTSTVEPNDVTIMILP
ncbi:hypothetical protein LJC01_00570 [Clostridiaceae bacterium OttesenSCG-928-D20]|nr:hypothetical protein [Clostridiaceae bacterium OttesenSCG-928-D20]